MEQLLAHLIGDYVLQNHWMANRKTSSSLAAGIHVLLYGLPFLLLVSTPLQWAIIVGTHFAIDRWRLAALWVDFWGTGKAGWLPIRIEILLRGNKIAPPDSTGDFSDHPTISNSLLPRYAPPWLGVWLLILVDNTLHMSINYATLTWL